MSETINTSQPRTIEINQKAFDRLSWAKKKDEDYSDVIIRLTTTKLDGLQRRGEKEIRTSDNKRLILMIDQGKCMGAESCVAIAPNVFALDESNLGFGRSEDAPLAMRDVMEGEVDSDTVIEAARSCPYKAIYVKDSDTGEEIFP
ncbi:MAG: ferredoxin [Nitrososphaerota archaeon]|nr:ferredoxin [Nitrososphaerota archaeon]